MISKIFNKLIDKLYVDLYQDKTKEFIGVPTDVAVLIELLEEIKSDSGVFLDLGSGISNVLLAAHEVLGDNYTLAGVEHQENYLNFALGLTEAELYKEDLFSNVSKELILKSDIIYTYAPLAEVKDLQKLITFITSNLQEGSYFIFNGYGGYLVKDCDLIKEIDSDMNQKFRLYKKL
jgi:hypothetical protein